MAKILLIEDEGSYASTLKKECETRGHKVTSAYSYKSAIGLWKKYYGDFECIVLDLNIDPDGLDEQQIDEYSPIHGILVLDKICNGEMPEKSEKSKKIWNITILHSGFTTYLDKFPQYESLKTIPKGGPSISKVAYEIDKIVNRPKNVDDGQ